MLNSLDTQGRPQDTRVVVAMSGGVDSSVTAALLKAEGYDVVGVTLQLYDHGAATHRKGACCAGRDIHDARAVAARIGIPHYVLDYEARFKEAVIDRFAESYAAGETPVPCVECNRAIKFADLLGTARELGASVLATGHYVRSVRRPDGSRALHRALESERDQSYFLFATTREQLDVLRFPLGSLPKAKVRELAREFGLAIADKQDSQDICFVPSGRYADVIDRLKPGAAAPGDIVDQSGKVLGRHDGIIHFTVGQRKGLKIAAREPLYVLQLEADTRRVVVGPRSALTTRTIALHDVNWIGDGALEDAARRDVFVKVRSTRPPRAAWLSAGRDGITVELVEGEEGVAPGQACVFYDSADDGARVLGGGFIRAAAVAAKRTESAHASARGEGAMADTLDRGAVEKAYARWAPVYDLVFGKVFDRGRQASIQAAERVGGRILEVGVGTGISLPDYARTNRIVGIDISAPMLRKAAERVAQYGLSNVEALAVMDAKHLAFPDNTFDVVVAQYVITAVPDPEATLDEFARVLKPGGEIVLVNHIGAETGARKVFELAFAPLARRLGWRPEFPWARLTGWMDRTRGIHFIERRPMPPLGHFSLIRYGKTAGAQAAV